MCCVVFQYKDFLDRLTPMEWFDQQRQLKKDRQARRRQARMDAKRHAWEVRTCTDIHSTLLPPKTKHFNPGWVVGES